MKWKWHWSHRGWAWYWYNNEPVITIVNAKSNFSSLHEKIIKKCKQCPRITIQCSSHLQIRRVLIFFLSWGALSAILQSTVVRNSLGGSVYIVHVYFTIFLQIKECLLIHFLLRISNGSMYHLLHNPYCGLLFLAFHHWDVGKRSL